MKLSSLCMLMAVFCLCACQGMHQQYIPAPNEMPADSNFSTDQQHTPEELIDVQSTQAVNPDVLQAIMKTRGFIYKGYRVIKSQYSPSTSDIKKAAYAIGASQALYFIIDQKTVREEKEKMNLGDLIGGIVGAKSKSDYQTAIRRGLRQTRYRENVTYYTYYITYWKKTDGDNPILLNKNEVAILKKEQANLRRTATTLQKRMRRLESQMESMQSISEKKSQHYNNAILENNKSLVKIKTEISDINEKIQQTNKQESEINNAIDINDAHRENMHYLNIPSK